MGGSNLELSPGGPDSVELVGCSVGGRRGILLFCFLSASSGAWFGLGWTAPLSDSRSGV